MIIVLFLSFTLLILIGMPIAFALALASTGVLYFLAGMPLLLIMQRIYSGLDAFALMAIPLFLLAGHLMTAVKISEKLVALASVFLGHYRGGLSLVATGASAIFGAISGSANATTAAIGATMVPAMKKRGYDQADAAAVVAASGILGLVIPPSITMVLYGVVAGVSIGDLFLSGIVPGVLIAFGLMVVNYRVAVKKGYPAAERIPLREAGPIFRASVIAMMMPILILGGIYSGAFTPTESAAVACLYGLLVGIFWYRNIGLPSIFRIARQTVEGTAAILFLIATANIFTYVLSSQNVPQQLAAGLLDLSQNPYVIMGIILVILLILGTFLDNVAAIILITPTLMPVINAVGIDPVYFGVYMVIAVAVGQITPPVGINLFIATSLTDRKLGDVIKASVPYFGLYLSMLIMFIFTPRLLSLF